MSSTLWPIHIVFDGPPAPEAGRFVEVETHDGKSISVGEWQQHGAYWHLVIPAPAPPAPAPVPTQAAPFPEPEFPEIYDRATLAIRTAFSKGWDAAYRNIAKVIDVAATLKAGAQPTTSGPSEWDATLRGPQMSAVTGLTIFKYQMPVLEQFEMKLPYGAMIIRMESQGGMFWLWALVDTNAPIETRKFRAFKTGAPVPPDLKLQYLGFCAVFVQMELGLYIFEELP